MRAGKYLLERERERQRLARARKREELEERATRRRLLGNREVRIPDRMAGRLAELLEMAGRARSRARPGGSEGEEGEEDEGANHGGLEETAEEGAEPDHASSFPSS